MMSPLRGTPLSCSEKPFKVMGVPAVQVPVPARDHGVARIEHVVVVVADAFELKVNRAVSVGSKVLASTTPSEAAVAVPVLVTAKLPVTRDAAARPLGSLSTAFISPEAGPVACSR